ncbi:MAG TPA: substrate-binding domain-containing protein [Devosia sp.]|nr:substrate-binding domain-containing protein [Devosia sp.]
MTIKDLAAELELSITTISRALNGYSDVGEKTRARVEEAARRMGYQPNRNAQRLVLKRTHSIAWVQSANELKYLDPHFAEVMAGVLTSARRSNYDVVLTSHEVGREIATYERYVRNDSVDGFIIDLPQEDDQRIDYLLQARRPFVVHGRDRRSASYGWVDMDNYGNFYRLVRLLIANGHRRIAFVNGDEAFNYALYRKHAVRDAVADAGLPEDSVAIYNSAHPMGDAGFRLTQRALADTKVTAILYSSILLLVEGYEVLAGAGLRDGRPIAIATMDDELRHIDQSRLAPRVTFVRSSLHDAGVALIEELSRQCDGGQPPSNVLVPSRFQVAPGIDGATLDEPLPMSRREKIG